MEPRNYGPFPYTPINRRPKLTWPNGARVAVWVIPNIEFFPLNEPIPGARGPYVPEVSAWSVRDYGARVGVFRIMDVLSKRDIRASVTLNSEVCDAYPEILEDAMALNWEFLGHNQSNSRPFHVTPPEGDKQLVHDTMARITETRDNGRADGSARGFRRHGIRWIIWPMKGSITCATGSMTTSPISWRPAAASW